MELKYKNKLVSNWEAITNYVFKVLCPVLKSEAYVESYYRYCKTFRYTLSNCKGDATFLKDFCSGDAIFEVLCEQNEVSISISLSSIVIKTIFRNNACIGTFVRNGRNGCLELRDYNFNTSEWVYNEQALKLKQEKNQTLEQELYYLLRDVECQWQTIKDDITRKYFAIMNFSIN